MHSTSESGAAVLVSKPCRPQVGLRPLNAGASARPRSFASVNTLAMIASDVGKVSAAPTPMAARLAVNAAAFAENAANGDETPKITNPSRNTLARPKRSPRLPPISNKPAKTKM